MAETALDRLNDLGDLLNRDAARKAMLAESKDLQGRVFAKKKEAFR